MATNKPATEEAAARAPELLDIDDLRKRHRTGRAVFAGVCAAQGWRPGKAVTEAEFLAAVRAFTGAPMGPAKPAKESEAKK